MNHNFAKALNLVLKHEGGFVDHPKDPGGATNKGITIATFRRYVDPKGTVDDLKRITPEQIAQVYRKHYWNAVKGDQLPDGVDYAVFDFAVNSGPSRAAKYLQGVVKVPQDGKIGPVTLASVNLVYRDAVDFATTANISLTGSQTVDGVASGNGKRALVKNQSTPSQNGIYVTNSGGAWTRATDADTGAEMLGTAVLVRGGTANGNKIWACTTPATITIGSTSLTFSEIISLQDMLDAIEADVLDYGDAVTSVDNVTYSAIEPAAKLVGNAIISSQAASFSGFGNLYTLPGSIDFNAVRLVSTASAPTDPDEQVYRIGVEVRDVSKTGTLLASGSINIDPTLDWLGDVLIPLDADLTEADFAGPEFFVAYRGYTKDGSPAVVGQTLGTVEHYASQSYYTTTGAPGTWSDYATDPCIAIELAQITDGVQTTVRRMAVRPQMIDAEPDMMALPSLLPAVVGRPLNIYLANMSGIRPDLLDWSGVCTDANAKLLNEMFSLTTAATGDLALRLDAHDPITWKRLTSRSSTIKRVAANAGAGDTPNMLFVGDSTTYQTSTTNGGIQGYLEAFLAMSAAEGGGGLIPTLIGTQGTGSVKHEGYSGRTVPWFLTDAASPFVFASTFNFGSYMSTNHPAVSTLDYFVSTLGVNSYFYQLNEGRAASVAAIEAGCYEQMIASIRAFDANTKIWIAMPFTPAYDQDGFGATYGFVSPNNDAVTRRQVMRNHIAYCRVMQAHFDGRDADGIYFLMPGLCLDTQHNMKRAAAAAWNADTAETVERQTDPIHPPQIGYKQVARMYWDWLKVLEA